MTQSIQPVTSIGKTFPEIPKSQVTIYEAHTKEKKFKDYKSNKEINEITKSIGLLCAYVGYEAEKDELVLMNLFVRNTFPRYNLTDLKQAIERYTRGDTNVKDHYKVTAMFLGKILNAYKPYKGGVITKINNKISDHNKMLPLPKPSPEESLKLFIELLRNAHMEAIKGIFMDGGSIVYKHLKNHNLIDFSEAGVKEANDYAKKQLGFKRKQSVFHAVIKSDPIPKEKSKAYKIQMLMREHAVNKWLRAKSHKDMDEYINTLKPEDYE